MSRSPARTSPAAAPPAADPKPAEAGAEGTRIPTLNDDLVLVRLNAANAHPARLGPEEQAGALVRKAVQALAKPGIRRESVFGSGTGHGINAYSVYPADPTKVVRESADGRKTIGRLVGGRFRPTGAKP